MTINELTLQLNNGLDVYTHYIDPNVPLNKKMISPLRPDERNPSFGLYMHSTTGEIWFSDFGDGGELSRGNHWTFVMAKFGLDFRGAVSKVKADILGIGEKDNLIPLKRFSRNRIIVKPDPVLIEPEYRELTVFDVEFFDKAKIDEYTLDKYHVRPAKSYLLKKGEKKFTITEKDDDPIYIIDFPSGRRKVYRPYTKNRKFKWLSNTLASEDVFGLDSLPESCEDLFIISGNRDTMSFNKIMEIPAIALNSETANLPHEIFMVLSMIAKRIHIMYDPDDQGKKKSTEIANQFGLTNHTRILDYIGFGDFSNMVEKSCTSNDLIGEFKHLLSKEI